ncbi:hypothetical protein Tco_0585234 [Tanacetum coccineum]
MSRLLVFGKSREKPLGSSEVDFKVFEGTANVGLVYGRDQGKHMDVGGFVYADYAKDPDKDRSIIGYVFMVHGCVLSWKATLQHVVALSTTEAEYMALTEAEAVKEIIWLKGLLVTGSKPKTKHINVRYHFIREIVESKKIEVAKTGTEDNAADAFTKVVPGVKLQRLKVQFEFNVDGQDGESQMNHLPGYFHFRKVMEDWFRKDVVAICSLEGLCGYAAMRPVI